MTICGGVLSAAIAVALLGGAVGAPVDPEPGGEEVAYIGDETCLGCHDDPHDYRGTIHAKVLTDGNACEACHGPGGRHAEEADPAFIRTFDPARKNEDPRDWDAACLGCHEKASRGRWRGSTHQIRGVACTSCHTLMKPVSDRALLSEPGEPVETCYTCHLLRRAQTWRSSHKPMREGKMDCMSCHQPHGSAGPSLLKAFSVNEMCYRCHAEKRGPFLYEHPPARESCANCHDPHGSIYDNLLVRDTPRLCQQCHIATRHPTTPNPADSRFVFNKACLNCHAAVHGSNHPSGHRFMR